MAPPTRRRLLALVIAACLCAPALAAATPTEYEVKAAFLYNFAKYVQWPAPQRSTLVIGVLGKDPFGPLLDEVMEGQSVQRRSVVIRRFARIEDVSGADILFVCSSERGNLPAIFAALQRRPVLTVADMDQFPELGGMINLTTEEKHVRFEMNPDAIRRAGLKAGSQLYRLARIVKEKPAGK
jgi:hypothetical protein